MAARSREVKKAVVLAAGLGTRLRPLTCTVPKPLLPIWGEPMLSRIVTMLREWGVEEIVVNCHYLHEQVEAWCAANGCRAAYEPEILGTGGVLNPLREWLGDDDFYLVNSDIVIEGARPLKWGERSVSGVEVIAECYATEAGPRTLEVEPESHLVTNFKSEDAGFPGTCTYCGLALISAELLRYVKPTGFSSIVEAYERAMADGRFVRAHVPDDLLWTDAGTVKAYLELNRDGDDHAYADLPQVRALLGENPEGLVCLGARGSDRVFFRSGEKVLVLYDDAKRGENARYAALARWLKEAGVPVPAVLRDESAAKALVMEWGGAEKRLSLDEAVSVVEALARFNRLGERFLAPEVGLPELEPPFDAALWRWERELFAEHCLGSRYRMAMPRAVREELERVAERLEREPKALVHRDFQSTNILWRTVPDADGRLQERLCLIDFQGMRLGPAAYDLASFLYDPYVKPFSDSARRSLVAVYARAANRPDIAEVVPLAAVERLVQCLGAYGRLVSVGQPQFARFVLPALENLLAAADEANLDAVGALAEELIAREQPHDGECGCGHDHGHDGCCPPTGR